MYIWYCAKRRLTQDEQIHNANNIVDYFRQQGWTDYAIAGMLGNIQNESAFNPAVEEGYAQYYPPSTNNVAPSESWWLAMYNNKKRGYGLVQWTPARKFKIWACQLASSRAGLPYTEFYVAQMLEAGSYSNVSGSGVFHNVSMFDLELERVQWEVIHNEQWAHYWGQYSTFHAFTQGTQDAGYMAKSFMRCYERPANISESNMEARARQGRRWYEIMQGLTLPVQTSSKKYLLIDKRPIWLGGTKLI